MEPYEKSYKGFVIWLVAFLAASFAVPFLPTENTQILTLSSLNVMSIGVAVLAWMIYRNEKIYWYNGIEYETARNTPSDVRRRYALRYAKRFIWCAVACAVYSLLAFKANIPIAFSITAITIGLVATAISTIKIKLE